MDSLNQLNKILLENKTILVRGDLDVPVVNGRIVDASRLEALRETLDYLILRGSRVVLMGHMGRPEGKVVEELRLDPVADYLRELGYGIVKVNSVLGVEVHDNLKILKPGEVLLLENLRFDPREEKNDELFSSDLASLGHEYVNESFATSHRAHASTYGITFKTKAYAGIRLCQEVENISKAIDGPRKPVVAILGGVKIETKLPVIARFLSIADYVLLGGKLGLTYEGDNNSKILVPIDYAADNLDIGEKTIPMFENVIKIAKTIIWNGPMGKFEDQNFLQGTKRIAQAVAESEAFSVVGGGDTIEALNKVGLLDKMSFVSMGGGAMLEFIAGNRLPGLEALGYYG